MNIDTSNSSVSTMSKVELVDEILTRGVEEIIVKENLEKRLKDGKPLRIKYGVDPTKPDIHLGHMVQLKRLKALQDLGHTIIFLIGDYTTKIGDPSGRNTTRPVLSDEEIKANATTYFAQIDKILDMDKTEVRYNSEWFSKMTFSDILKLAGNFSANQILERDDFTKRLKEGSSISFHELLYPVMQAYDSVELKADVEFGGSDQKFNMLAGRDLQKKMELPPQDVVMMKILVGLDGKAKMSKSLNNYIGVTDAPIDMFGKIMSIPDELMLDYYELATDVTMEAIEIIKKELAEGKNPREVKAELAELIVETYHGAQAAQEARAEFDRVYKNRETPTDAPTINIAQDKINIIDLIIETKLASSKSEARRLVEQGGVEIAGAKVSDPNQEINIENNMILQVGKHKFVKVQR